MMSIEMKAEYGEGGGEAFWSLHPAIGHCVLQALQA